MHISFGRTAYVAGTPSDILDGIVKRMLNVSMTGDGWVCTDWDQMPQEDPGEGASKVEAFLWKAAQDIQRMSAPEDHIGDVIFAH